MLSFLKKFYHYLVSVFFYWCYGRPAKKMIVIGVTGTKGKSTTCRFIASVLEQTGNKVGLMSTVEFQDGNNRYLNDKKMTMLGRGEIHKMMAQMLKNGCKYAVIETSSEGILQFRHFGLHYDICVFTNLGTEHQERHGGFENLRRDKGKIFAGLNKDKRKIIDGKKMEKIIIANTDDENAEYFLRFEADKKIAFGQRDQYLVEKENSLNARILKVEGQKTEFEVNNFLFNLNLAGVFNIYNALPAIAIGKIFLLPLEKIATGIAVVKKVEGRMEFIEEGQNFNVVVDYAHESMSLTALFETLRNLVRDKKIIGIIGSDGGGRDKSKRKEMGKIAGQLCDIVIITDVNCFDENPKEIAEMLAVGVRETGKKDEENLFIVIDREQAIKKALSLAKAGDVVAITAKGTEPCIVIEGGKKIPWDDREVTRKILKTL
ncbi:MAG TPA: UDP-N-acetylmuramyl-tripeptide synthetase [Candidatus Magasanikbacteria bacterium]|nr:UDP-N-acetylmuramyl-tripeptide synthetase [Candidatus Magasanikbacteria bacterium]